MNVVKFLAFKFLKDGASISIVGRVVYYFYRSFLQDYNSLKVRFIGATEARLQ